MTSKVAIIEFDEERESFSKALHLIGGADDLDTQKRQLVVKVGIFSHAAENHTSVRMVDAIVSSFNNASKIFLVESDNYKGTGFERLRIYHELFTDRVTPFNLSQDSDTRKVRLTGEEMRLSHLLFKPNVLISTHILRQADVGSILKNLFGCIPTSKKAKYHKVLPVLLADLYEAIGGIDLAVIDGTYFWHKIGDRPIRVNTLLVGRDAVAVETVGAALAGLQSEKMPITQEFVRRGIGEGDLKNIEIVGASFESLKEKIAHTTKTRKSRPRKTEAQTWGGQMHRAFKSLVQEGFFKLPNKRTMNDVIRALEARGMSAKGMEDKIADALARRVKRGILKAAKGPDGWNYWTQ